MPRQDPLRGHEADASSRELGVAVHALERTEELTGMLHVEADAVVPHVEATFAVRSFAADFDDGVRCRRGVLVARNPGIALRRGAVGVMQSVA